jgi:hypothetical protein
MRESRTSGSEGALGEQSPRATRPAKPLASARVLPHDARARGGAVISGKGQASTHSRLLTAVHFAARFPRPSEPAR